MSRIAYVNGRYVPHAQASVHIEDRGYQFADGVYEVSEIRDGALIDVRRHLDRLDRSLAELRIPAPMSRAALTRVLIELIRKNRVRNGFVYLQVTRGVARRDHMFPPAGTVPALVATVRAADPVKGAALAADGIAIVTRPDERWARVDIKTIGLLANVLAKQSAREAGAKEVWLVDRDGYVTEGGSTNAWIVTRDGDLVTTPSSHAILTGITRAVVMETAAAEGLRVVERRFTPEEAKSAREAFVTAATQIVMPVVRIDDASIGNGRPGSIATRLREAFHMCAERTPVF